MLNNNIDTTRAVLRHLPVLALLLTESSDPVLQGEPQARYADYMADITVPFLKSLNQRMRGYIARHLDESPTTCLDLAKISDNRVLAKLAAIKMNSNTRKVQVGFDVRKVHPFFAPYLLTGKYPTRENFKIELTDIKKVLQLHKIKPLILDGYLTLEAVADLAEEQLENLVVLKELILKNKISIEETIKLDRGCCLLIERCKELLLVDYLSLKDINCLTHDESLCVSNALHKKGIASLITHRKLNFESVKSNHFDTDALNRISDFFELILDDHITVDEILACSYTECCAIYVLCNFIKEGRLTVNQVKELENYYTHTALSALKGLFYAKYVTLDDIKKSYSSTEGLNDVFLIKPFEKLIIDGKITFEEIKRFQYRPGIDYSQIAKLIATEKIEKDDVSELTSIKNYEKLVSLSELADLILNDKISVEDAKKVKRYSDLSRLSVLILSGKLDIKQAFIYLRETSLLSLSERSWMYIRNERHIPDDLNFNTHFSPELMNLVVHNHLTLDELLNMDFSISNEAEWYRNCLINLSPLIIAGKITMKQVKELTSQQIRSLGEDNSNPVLDLLIEENIISLKWWAGKFSCPALRETEGEMRSP